MLIVSGVGTLIVAYSIGYMHGDRQGTALLRLPGPVPVLDAAPRHVGELRAAPRRLGPGRPLVVPADRVLARAQGAGRRRQEGVRDERDRRRGHRHRDLHHRQRPRDRRVPGGVRPGRRPLGAGVGDRQLDRVPAARRRRREVGPDPAPHLASRRHGGPDPGLGADPRGDDGDRRRLPGRAHARALRERARHPGARRPDRRRDPAHGRGDRARPDRHQTHHRLLDDEPDRLHVRRRRDRRLLGRDVPAARARLLQGPALPRRGHRDPRPERRAGRPQDGRPAAGSPAHDLA